MGSDGSKMSPQDVEKFQKCTSFTGDEIQDWYTKFYKDCPSGYMNRDDFKRMYLKMFPNGDATAFADEVFGMYDKNGDGQIEFREFLCTLSVSAKGSIDEKLRWAFSLYDRDGNGYVDKEEAAKIVQGILQLRSGDLQGVVQPGFSTQDTVDQIFSALDKDNDQQLTEFEFVMGAKSSPQVLGILQGF